MLDKHFVQTYWIFFIGVFFWNTLFTGTIYFLYITSIDLELGAFWYLET